MSLQLSALFRRFLATFGLLAAAVAAAQQPQVDLQRMTLLAGMYRIDTQVATTPEQRETGLMFRKEMPQAEGMVFVFEQRGTQCFWMRNTLIPLSAAFVADDGRIVNIADMKPLSTNSHCSEEPVRYVLEMNQGWFASKGIGKGFKLGGSLFAAPR